MSEPLLRLTTFGGLALLRDGEPVAEQHRQRRYVALLALVAASGRGSVSRARVFELFWPDLPAETGEQALTQSMQVMRRTLGADVLKSDATTLRIDPTLLRSDAQEFDSSIVRDPQRAIALYLGPFMDGFSLDGPPAMDRWLVRKRLRFAQRYTMALQTLATRADRDGDGAAAVRWWRLLVGKDPLNGRAAVGLIQALVHAGDRRGALQFASIHTSLVRQELGTRPDAAIAKWVECLRSATTDGKVAPTAASP